MKNKGLLILTGAIAGFIIGYLLFGKILGSYVSLGSLLDFSGGDFGNFGRSLGGIKGVQQKVFLSGGAGAIIALVYSVVKKK